MGVSGEKHTPLHGEQGRRGKTATRGGCTRHNLPWRVSLFEGASRTFSFTIALSQETPSYAPTRPSNPVSQSHLDEFFPTATHLPWPEHGSCQPPWHSISHMLPVHPGSHEHVPSSAQVPCLEHVLSGPPRHSIPQLIPL